MICSDESELEFKTLAFKLISIKELGNCEYEIIWHWKSNTITKNGGEPFF